MKEVVYYQPKEEKVSYGCQDDRTNVHRKRKYNYESHLQCYNLQDDPNNVEVQMLL